MSAPVAAASALVVIASAIMSFFIRCSFALFAALSTSVLKDVIDCGFIDHTLARQGEGALAFLRRLLNSCGKVRKCSVAKNASTRSQCFSTSTNVEVAIEKEEARTRVRCRHFG